MKEENDDTEEEEETYGLDHKRLDKTISNNEEYFDLLFDLLNLGISNVTTAVWNLLVAIPVNKKLYQTIRNLNDVKKEEDQYTGWNHIIDPSSTYKMLYSLNILNTQISVNKAKMSDTEISESSEWRMKFLELGGFQHLY